MNKKSPIKWTDKQVQVADLLKEGLANKDVAAQLGVAKSLITKVAKVLKKGFQPPETSFKTENADAQLVAPGSSKATLIQPHTTLPKETEKHPAHLVHSSEDEQLLPAMQTSHQPWEKATVLHFKPVCVECAITPIMVNSRVLAAIEWGWDPKMPWEDFFDTVFYLYAKACGYILQSYYRKDA